MAYRVVVKITISKEAEGAINAEETTFDDLSFERMVKASAEYFELLTKIGKAIK